MKKRIEPFEGSEEERFRKALAKCRNCGHVKIAHQILNNTKCLDTKLRVDGTHMHCACQNYEPIDNLEFLEFKLDKKLGKKK